MRNAYDIRVILRASGQNFRKWQMNPRFYMLLLLILAFFHLIVMPFRGFCAQVSYPISAFLFPYLTDDGNYLMILELGVIFLFCDAPFIDETQPYLIARSGRKRWLAGQFLYIAAASAVFTVVLAAVTVAYLFPHLSFSANDWGKAVNTLAQTSAGQGNLAISDTIRTTYTPLGGMLWSMLMFFLVSVFLGYLMLALNLFFKRAAGIIAATLLVFSGAFQMFISDSRGFLFYLFPARWASLGILDTTGTGARPYILYCIAILIAFDFLLSALSFVALRKKDIDVLPPV